MRNNKFTPAAIAQSEIVFSIPIYQRLFEWEKEQVEQLLNDLYQAYLKTQEKPEPYYIGMLTVYKVDNIYSLVDGQQRFTVLTLMAIAFDTEDWKSFLSCDSKVRLDFFGRTHDRKFLHNKIHKIESDAFLNKKMQSAINLINEFVLKIPELDRASFANYIYDNATFFISELPANYNQQDLNRYFEKMNSVGKSLENHEILKVNLLKHVDDKEFYNRLWNCVSEMDKNLIRHNLDKENVDAYRRRITNALENIENTRLVAEHCNDFHKIMVSSSYARISEISPTSENPSKITYGSNYRAILTFSEFLLQVLWIRCQNQHINKTDFFDVHKLQRTFKTYLSQDDVGYFLDDLLKYRIIFDQYIPRIVYNESQHTDYILNFSDNNKDENYACLLKFLSMQYVSTVSNRWLTSILTYLSTTKNISVQSYLEELKNQDNSRHPEIPTLNYHTADRYWFWRLDYYLWEDRARQFPDEKLKVAENYVFRQNRSIEHIAPQNPKRDSTIKVSDTLLHSFGNLCMISGGLNSSLQNEAFEIKKAHVQTYINGSKTGTIESLKMLKLYDYDTWNDTTITQHEEQMISILENSYKLTQHQELV